MSDETNKPRWQVYEDPNQPADPILRWPDGTPYRTRSVLLEGFVYVPNPPATVTPVREP
jgi:hypothetical protein